MIGTTINAYVGGGNPLLSQVDTSCDGGSTGVGSVGASFEADNVAVTAPSTNTCVQSWRTTTCGAFCTGQTQATGPAAAPTSTATPPTAAAPKPAAAPTTCAA